MSLHLSTVRSSNLLDRIGVLRTSRLTVSQQKMDALDANMSASLQDAKSLLAFTLGGFVGKVGKFASMGLGSSLLASGVGLGLEAVVIRGAEGVMEGKDLRESLEWRSVLSTALNVGVLQGAGHIFRNQNTVLRNAIQTSAMVGVNELAAKAHLHESSEGSVSAQLVDAFFMNTKMLAASSLFHYLSPRIRITEKSFELMFSMRSFVPSESFAQSKLLIGLSVMSARVPRQDHPNGRFALMGVRPQLQGSRTIVTEPPKEARKAQPDFDVASFEEELTREVQSLESKEEKANHLMSVVNDLWRELKDLRTELADSSTQSDLYDHRDLTMEKQRLFVKLQTVDRIVRKTKVGGIMTLEGLPKTYRSLRAFINHVLREFEKPIAVRPFGERFLESGDED